MSKDEELNRADRQILFELFHAKSIVERFAPAFSEMLWVLSGSPNPDQHSKPLPDYCYNILEVFRKTYFKHFPATSDVVLATEPTALAQAKTLEAARPVVRFDWNAMARTIGMGLRCLRFAQMEARSEADFIESDASPERKKQLFAIVFGLEWVRQNEIRISTEPPDKIIFDQLNAFLSPWLAKFPEVQSNWETLAYEWSSQAFVEYNQGMADGMTDFLDENGQLAGESERAGIYAFLLMLWPEIRAMQAAKPRKTLTDLHECLKPFMQAGLIPAMDIDYFRDVCAPPQSGIGLSLRPLIRRPPSA